MIRVLIVDDSAVTGALMSAIIGQQIDMSVIGVASNGIDGVAMAMELSPDVITMDIQMPGMDGFAAIRAILSHAPIPIIVVSAQVDDREMAVNFRAFELGAVAVERKPTGYSFPSGEECWKSLLHTIRAMHGVRPMLRRVGKPVERALPATKKPSKEPAVVAIGSSTGGPQVLQQILAGLPAGFALPVLVVQHLTLGFMPGMIAWLQGSCLLPIKQAVDGERLLPGQVYMAPDDRHLTVMHRDENRCVRLTDAAPVELFRPSVNVLFDSLAQARYGPSIGILLTGMGKDGAAGLQRMRQMGSTTIVQDKDSAVIYGMPGKALQLDAVDRVLTPQQMVELLSGFSRGNVSARYTG